MQHHHPILAELERYAERAGVSVATVCRKATNNPRLRERMVSRLVRIEADVEALRKFMKDNPVADARDVSCLSTIHGSEADTGQAGASEGER